MSLRLGALLCLACTTAAAADPPAPIIALFREIAEELSDQDAPSFLNHFDRQMPGLAQLKTEVEALLVRGPISSSIEFSTDEGDDRARNLEIDWYWRHATGAQRRVLVKCRVERQGRSWKITRLDPPDVFSEPRQ